MRYAFEKNLEGYRDVARDVESRDLTVDEQKQLDREIDSKIFRAARFRETSPDAQWVIYDLQEQKQRVMQDLHEKLAALDNPDLEASDNPKDRAVRKEGDVYLARGRNGHELPVTRGELLTDSAWGVKYRMDDSVERSLRKRYLVEEAKITLQDLLDKQITIDETSSRRTHELTRNAFERRAESTGLETGFIAEKMVKNFMKKLTIDRGADFEVLEADAFDDIIRKVDFIITRKHAWERGVGVEESDRAEQIGVQFTANHDPAILAHKKEQLQISNERLRDDDVIRDIVLVEMPTDSIRDVYNQWQHNPEPGGPDKLWDENIQREVFASVLQDLAAEPVIAEQWEKISANR